VLWPTLPHLVFTTSQAAKSLNAGKGGSSSNELENDRRECANAIGQRWPTLTMCCEPHTVLEPCVNPSQCSRPVDTLWTKHKGTHDLWTPCKPLMVLTVSGHPVNHSRWHRWPLDPVWIRALLSYWPKCVARVSVEKKLGKAHTYWPVIHVTSQRYCGHEDTAFLSHSYYCLDFATSVYYFWSLYEQNKNKNVLAKPVNVELALLLKQKSWTDRSM
jgi:hypothetical protein